jgi:hypothetical protein
VASLEKLRLWIPEPRDLALTKLERSNERGIRDVMFLAQTHGTNAGLAPDDAQYVDRGLLARRKVTLAKNQQIVANALTKTARTRPNVGSATTFPESGALNQTG